MNKKYIILFGLMLFSNAVIAEKLNLNTNQKRTNTAEINTMIFNEEFVKRDADKALAWYLSAAKQGNADAQTSVGRIYHNGSYGIDRDFNKANEWFFKAAKQNNKDAQFYLGFAYFNGQGVDEDIKKSIHWYQRSANQGHAVAQYDLSMMYFSGNGVKKI